jgi:hypothetical protein
MKKFIFINRRALDKNAHKIIKNEFGEWEPCIAISDKKNEREENLIHAYEVEILDSAGQVVAKIICNPADPFVLDSKRSNNQREQKRLHCWIEVEKSGQLVLKL